MQKLVREKGLFSFYQDGHKECCGIRKVEPLVRALRPLAAWVTGQRRDQSPGTRAEVPVVQLDPTFGSPEHPLVKFNPIANWTSKQVWAYIRAENVPYNALHDRGFISIGCEPCTRATNPGEHERATSRRSPALAQPSPTAISMPLKHMRRSGSSRRRALHPPGQSEPARARGALVVGGGDHERVRAARGERREVDLPRGRGSGGALRRRGAGAHAGFAPALAAQREYEPSSAACLLDAAYVVGVYVRRLVGGGDGLA